MNFVPKNKAQKMEEINLEVKSYKDFKCAINKSIEEGTSKIINYHFYVTYSDLSILLDYFILLKNEGEEDEFYDTPQMEFAKNNIWIKNRKGDWNIKFCQRFTGPFLGIQYEGYWGSFQEIEEKVKKYSNKLLPLLSELKPFANIQFNRIEFDQPFSLAYRFYIDVTNVKDISYIIGTIKCNTKGMASYKDPPAIVYALDFIQPVKNKIMEHILKNDKSLYQTLLGEIIPDLQYISPNYSRDKCILILPSKPQGEEEIIQFYMKQMKIKEGSERHEIFQQNAQENEEKFVDYLRDYYDFILPQISTGIIQFE